VTRNRSFSNFTAKTSSSSRRHGLESMHSSPHGQAMQPLHSLGPSGTTSGDPAAECRCTLPTTLLGGPGNSAATKGGSMHGSTFLVCMTRSPTCTLPHATSPRWTHGTQAPRLTTQMPGPRSGTMWVRHKDWALCSWPGTSMAGRAPALTIQQQRQVMLIQLSLSCC